MSKHKLSIAPFDPSEGRKNRKVPIKKVGSLVSKRIGNVEKQNNQPEQILKFAWVDPDYVVINYERQRYPEPVHIRKLTTKWQPEVMTPGQARKDGNGYYHLADGQQHLTAYVILYPDAPVPLFYVESDDEELESRMLLALNTDQQPMAKYFIHEQHCKMGDEKANAIEDMVVRANCETGYKISRPGSITHITDLYNAVDDYGTESVYVALTKYRLYWPTEHIKTATLLGFLKVKELIEENGNFSEELFDNVFAECADYFESSDRLHLDIKNEFSVTYPTNYKGMGVKEKIASGIINVYEKSTGNYLCDKPFEIDMPMMQV